MQQRQALQAQYTADHPDVVEINRKINDLQTQIASSAAEPQPAPVATLTRPDTPQLAATYWNPSLDRRSRAWRMRRLSSFASSNR